MWQTGKKDMIGDDGLGKIARGIPEERACATFEVFFLRSLAGSRWGLWQSEAPSFLLLPGRILGRSFLQLGLRPPIPNLCHHSK